MKHARKDYDRIQDPAGLIPDDEPVFLIRGQDKAALAAADAWCREAHALGAEPAIINAVLNHMDAVRRWQTEHGSKIPDAPTSALS